MNSSALMRNYPGYRLQAFEHILQEMLTEFPIFPLLENLVILELGPGGNLNLLHFLHEQSHAAAVEGIGRTRPSFWKRSVGAEPLVRDTYLLPALRQMTSGSVDLIYSRHVLEQHSIEAGVLLKDPEFKRAIAENRFDDLPESFPASPRNIQAIMAESLRVLKPGGVMITQIAKKKYGVLTMEKLQALQPARLNHRTIGRLSEIWTLVK